MNIEENLHLFTKIDNSKLDCLINGTFLIISKVKESQNDINYSMKTFLADVKNGCIFYPNGWGEYVTHEYVLDLEKLTTKERALHLADQSWDAGFEEMDIADTTHEESKFNFIENIKHIL